MTLPTSCNFGIQINEETPPENGAELKKHRPHSDIEYLDGHHASMVIDPGEVNRLFADFISIYKLNDKE
jgi:hypothetical protein